VSGAAVLALLLGILVLSERFAAAERRIGSAPAQTVEASDPLRALLLLGGLVVLCVVAALHLTRHRATVLRSSRKAERLLRALSETGPGREPLKAFEHLARGLACALECRWAMIARLNGDAGTLRTLGFWDTDHLTAARTCEVSGSAAESVLSSAGPCCYEKDVDTLFPGDHFLREIGANAYIGHPLHDPSGETIGLLCAAHDKPLSVSEETSALLGIYARRAEAELSRLIATEKLQASEATHRSVLDSLTDGVVTFDRQLRIRAVNPAAERLFGWPPGELIGREILDLLPPAIRSTERELMRWDFALTEGDLTHRPTREVMGYRCDGTTFPVEITVSGYQIGQELFLTAIVRDRSVQRKMEVEVRRLARESQR